jgi:hypothetical protein
MAIIFVTRSKAAFLEMTGRACVAGFNMSLHFQWNGEMAASWTN